VLNISTPESLSNQAQPESLVIFEDCHQSLKNYFEQMSKEESKQGEDCIELDLIGILKQVYPVLSFLNSKVVLEIFLLFEALWLTETK